MPVSKILILGAGPTGLSAAIALSKNSTESNPLQITVLELKPDIQTIGGAVYLTPLALGYLDFLGAGQSLRTHGHKVAAIDLISLRNGALLGSLWEGMDALRVSRKAIVESLLQTVRSEHSDTVKVRYGMRVTSISESIGGAEIDGKVVLEFDNGETLDGDVLLGCDGLHSAARRLYVEPGRKETYTGRVVAMGFANVEDEDARVRKQGGEQALRSTCLVQGQKGSLLISYWEPTKSSVFLASVRGMEEPNGDVRDGWKLAGGDGDFLKKDVLERYQDGGLQGLQELSSKCEEWNLYPVYKLPPDGTWQRNRVLLLGDAAHAVSHVSSLSLVVSGRF
jgi:2-polyprenyl-6-methoxyphenol hydroxylase-like FAD-dependent oxidoreductase